MVIFLECNTVFTCHDSHRCWPGETWQRYKSEMLWGCHRIMPLRCLLQPRQRQAVVECKCRPEDDRRLMTDASLKMNKVKMTISSRPDDWHEQVLTSDLSARA